VLELHQALQVLQLLMQVAVALALEVPPIQEVQAVAVVAVTATVQVVGQTEPQIVAVVQVALLLLVPKGKMEVQEWLF
jgi:hypothetical protein